MEALEKILGKLYSETSSEPMSDREYQQFQVDTLNEIEGDLNTNDGYECRACRNKGYIYRLAEVRGHLSQMACECKCMTVRRTIMRLRKSGLNDIIKDYAFERFRAEEPWQRTIKAAAEEYARNPAGWFFLGGQSGAGKTHLCTAICREFLLAGRSVQYMMWRDDIVKIKTAATDAEKLAPLLDRYKTVDVLYIDDLFKTGRAPDGSYQRPTSADINYAFEILNYRSLNPNLLTIISSEWAEAELLEIDEAIAGRIYEKAKGNTFSISKDRRRNYRLKGAVTL